MLVVLLVGVPALVLMNAFFVATEYALVRSRLDRIQAMSKEGVRGAKLAERQIEHIDEYIAACQVGITFASIGIGAVGEPAFADVLKKPFGDVLGHAAATALAVAIAYSVLTILHITFGELVPKIYTVGHAEGVARRIARPLEFFTRLFRPWALVACDRSRMPDPEPPRSTKLSEPPQAAALC